MVVALVRAARRGARQRAGDGPRSRCVAGRVPGGQVGQQAARLLSAPARPCPRWSHVARVERARSGASLAEVAGRPPPGPRSAASHYPRTTRGDARRYRSDAPVAVRVRLARSQQSHAVTEWRERLRRLPLRRLRPRMLALTKALVRLLAWMFKNSQASAPG
eukprot:362856-Chlamydomonas_euryale.AAC.14